MSFKNILVAVLLFAGIIILGLFALSVGGANIGFIDIIDFILGKNDNEIIKTIVFDLRAPRIIMAILIGMLLASSGVVTQSVFLNPLADPYIIGIAASAIFGAVVAYLLNLDSFYYGIFAFISSAILSLVIFKLASQTNSIATLLIIGIALSSFLGAFTSFATYLIGEDSFKIVAWSMGYLGGATWDKVFIICIPLVFFFFYFYIKRNELNILLNGDDEAKSLGIDTGRVKKIFLIVSALAVSFSVAFTGMIGFVGLIIPHSLRLLLKTSNNAILIPFSLLAGGFFVLFCDVIAKSLLSPIEIPIGVITAFFGAPFFLILAIKSRRSIA
ncbi:iron ABC transporter [Campylobacter pinnipediorum subsp. caledonicus]|uniref:FecCD family ABC transporter permease n=1 Tax=Campylobacter pinnipediorum TaxID=1965231 RepID=UPI000995131D|nr:iron ABC transporter permease [Campylobacter pinnipediorum]OPA72542.1 iron ABC transporter [Campylobacter pinnipediorum subsp. caledonicus]